MTTPVPEPPQRQDPPTIGGERAMLQGWLDFHRQTLLTKCAGLDKAQLSTASAVPSALTLLGLVRHMSEVERGWFRTNAAAVQLDDVYCTPEEQELDFFDLADADASADVATFRAECLAADAAVEGLDLEHTFSSPRGKPMSLRWVYLHMIEEYARHNGHADIIREAIDGVTGD